ncbi:acylneuraminate cytidylyltransferase family protein [bacterium]|jgi:N,N'-diacetyl-8-epilegionaminate cytidylyltransferase|nr:acylneuraminate cytidylyltransferase family protein [bacterium]
MKYVVLICARGGSKGLPGKNIKPLNGIPLIGWSINIAKKIDRVSHIIVSTDSEEIKKIALEYGAKVPFKRPKNLAQDGSPEWLVWQHAIKYIERNLNENIDAIVVLPTTSPLRSIDDVNACIDLFENENVESVITVNEANRSPYFNMTINDSNGYTSLVIPPKSQITRRQDAPKVFDMTTVAYVVSTDFVKNYNGIFDGRVKSIVIPQKRAIDIDYLIDFKIAELILKNEDK